VILRKRDARTIGYDNLDRVKTKDVPGSATYDVYSDYDLAGRPLYARFESATGAGIDYPAGNRSRMTFPDSNYVDYDSDALNRIWEVRENGAALGASVTHS
jgi:hypothetical protein